MMLFMSMLSSALSESIFGCFNFGFELKVNQKDLYDNVETLTGDLKTSLSIQIGDCTAKFELDEDDSEYFASITSSWQDCNINPDQNDDTIFFYSEVIPDPAVVVGQDDVEIEKTTTKPYSITCSYATSMVLDTTLTVSSVTTNAAEVSSDGEFNDAISLKVYTDDAYTTQIEGDVTVTLGDRIYAELVNNFLPSSLEWFIDHCKVGSDDKFTTSMMMFEDYDCANDMFGTTFESDSNNYRFNFMSFWFADILDSSEQHLACLIRICPSNSETCSPKRPTECEPGFTLRQ